MVKGKCFGGLSFIILALKQCWSSVYFEWFWFKTGVAKVSCYMKFIFFETKAWMPNYNSDSVKYLSNCILNFIVCGNNLFIVAKCFVSSVHSVAQCCTVLHSVAQCRHTPLVMEKGLWNICLGKLFDLLRNVVNFFTTFEYNYLNRFWGNVYHELRSIINLISYNLNACSEEKEFLDGLGGGLCPAVAE